MNPGLTFAYDHGKGDYFARKDAGDNPYTLDILRKAWADGWHDAESFMIKTEADVHAVIEAWSPTEIPVFTVKTEIGVKFSEVRRIISETGFPLSDEDQEWLDGRAAYLSRHGALAQEAWMLAWSDYLLMVLDRSLKPVELMADSTSAL